MPWPKVDAEHVMVNATQMASFESEILSNGFPVAALMEKVGQSMANWFLQHSDLIKDGVVVLVGPGHNGGDGLVVARELFLAGVRVEIWCPLNSRKTLTAKHLSYANWLGLPLIQETPDLGSKALWIDALFGLAQSKPLPDHIANLFKERQSKMPGRLVSLDIPSGICSDSGRAFPGGAAFASFTLTVGLIKQGLIQGNAIRHVGKLIRIDIGLPPSVFDKGSNVFPLGISPSDLTTVRWPQLSLDASKYERGRVLVVAGSDQYRGAGLLALKGVMASGAGSVQAILPDSVANSLWQVAPEVVLAGVIRTSGSGSEIGKLLARQDLSRVDALLIGPGLGKIEKDWLVVLEILQDFDGLLVLDADALNQLAFSLEGWRWIIRRKAPTWITPHLSEFRRLFASIQEQSLLFAAMEAAKISNAGVLLKGSHSVIADPKGMTWQLMKTAPWVARTGLGDLLAGFVSGVGALAMASGNGISSEFLAAAAFVHAEAARRCKKGSSATSIVERLQAITRNIQSRALEFDTHSPF